MRFLNVRIMGDNNFLRFWILLPQIFHRNICGGTIALIIQFKGNFFREKVSFQTVDKRTHRKNAGLTYVYVIILLDNLQHSFLEPKTALQKHFCLLRQKPPTVPLYADGGFFLVCVCFSKSVSLSKNTFSTS